MAKIESSQYVLAMGLVGAEFGYTEDGKKFRWHGKMPKGVKEVANDPNVFISEQNLSRWNDWVSELKEEEKKEAVAVDSKSLEILKMQDDANRDAEILRAMSKAEICNIGRDKYGIEDLKESDQKEDLILYLIMAQYPDLFDEVSESGEE